MNYGTGQYDREARSWLDASLEKCKRAEKLKTLLEQRKAKRRKKNASTRQVQKSSTTK